VTPEAGAVILTTGGRSECHLDHPRSFACRASPEAGAVIFTTGLDNPPSFACGASPATQTISKPVAKPSRRLEVTWYTFLVRKRYWADINRPPSRKINSRHFRA